MPKAELSELLFILIMFIVVTIISIVSIYLFIRQYNREKKENPVETKQNKGYETTKDDKKQ